MTTKNFYRLLPVQIPMFWEAIKFGCSKSEGFGMEDKPVFYIDLLHSLLNGTAQCTIMLDEKKVLTGIAVTKTVVNKITQLREFVLYSLYSMQKFSNEEILYAYELLKKAAIKEGCATIGFTSSNPKIWEWARLSGVAEKSRYFSLDVKN